MLDCGRADGHRGDDYLLLPGLKSPVSWLPDASLVVEDDRMIAQGLQTALRQDGHAVDWMQDGPRGAEALRTTKFDLVLLDLGLPGKDGLDVLRELRGRSDATPVIILTARDEVSDRIAGLDAGADDYLVKPSTWTSSRRACVPSRVGRRVAATRPSNIAASS